MKIAIASGKGGTGKTTLAVNLSAYLAEREKITLVDLDVEEPNSGLFIKGTLMNEEIKYKMRPVWDEERCILCGECQQVCNFHAVIQIASQIMIFPELCHSCYACSELCPQEALPMKGERMGVLKHYEAGNISFIESRLDIGQEQAVPLIAQTNDYIREHTGNGDLILIDSPPGTSCPVIEAAKDADYVMLVTEPTPFGLHDLKLTVETMKKLGREIGVVVNREGIGDSNVFTYCEENDIPVLARIPNNRMVAELYARGCLIYNEMDDVAKQLEKLHQFIESKKMVRR